MMVRINLLPGKKRGGGGGALWRLVAVLLVLFLAELLVLYVAYDEKATELAKQQSDLQKAQAAVTQLEAEVAALPEAEKQAKDLEARERALAQLASVRQGPQHTLDELKRVLSRPKTKGEIRRAKEAKWNVAWEVENVFLKKFFTEQEDALRIIGYARTLDDIAEFWLRMRSSKLFREVRLTKIGDATDDRGASVELHEFEFSARANFYYITKEGAALKERLDAAEKEAAEASGDQQVEKAE